MDEQLRREIRRLRRTNMLALTLLAVVAVSAFWQGRARTAFDEIDVHRINVRDANGKLRLTISNRERLPDVVVGGKSYPLRGGTGVHSAGLIFFNDEGNEDGGLIWQGHRRDDGYQASASLTFDQYNQDETVSLEYQDVNRRRHAGLTVADRSDEPIQIFAESLMAIRAVKDTAAQRRRMEQFRRSAEAKGGLAATRLFAGKQPDRSAVVVLSDPNGRPRLRLVVDSLGSPRIDFLDDGGHVTRSLTGAESR
jgi:hypothetical protein